MHHNIIYRCTDAGWKRPSIWIGETLESRDGTVVTDERIGYLVQLEGRYARLDMFCQFAKCLTNELVCLTHQLYFILSLQEYLHRRLICSHAATVNTARTEQTIIVAHQQMALDLSKRIKHNTDKNQQ